MFFVGWTDVSKVRQNDADGYPLYKGAAAKITGVCTVESGIFSSSSIDKEFEASNIYYRLKQIDFDGTYEYSEVVNESVGNPSKFELLQNYPNPFNPSTVIKFRLSETAQVRLSIYNVLGEKVTTLVNGKLDAGYYSYNFNASNLANGIYFYELNAGSYSYVKKMVLQK